MVHYEGYCIDYPTVDMYKRSGYSPPGTTMYNVPGTTMYNTPGTSVPTYDAPSYHTTVPPVDTATTMYYDQQYGRPYWQQHTAKDDIGISSYQHPGWNSGVPYQADIESMEAVYKHPGYLTGHPQNEAAVHSMSQQTAHYPPCAVMSTESQNIMTQQQVLEEEMAKERQQSQSYSGWITGNVNNNCKTRTKDKYRVVYSDHQRLELEKEFHYSRYITIRRKAELAVTLNLSERQVKIWFQNRRAKERKMIKKKGGDDAKFGGETDSRGSPCSSECNETMPQSHDMTSHADPTTNTARSSDTKPSLVTL